MRAFLIGIALGSLALTACAAHDTETPAPIAQAAPALTTPTESTCAETRLNIYFDMYDVTLTQEARETIDAFTHTLNGCRIDHVRVVGLAGALGGTPDENMALSQERANAVADYLVSSTQWPRDHFEIVARGDQNATNDDGEARPMRRRARIVVTASAPT